ncbi:retrovirus-related Pol polyprotein from transposon 412 [Trichonephila clavipes]|nr:retrovirus-related Pol polyprotein from transposon 412 [Trichonephila clavipes]
MDGQLKALLEGITALKSDQEDMQKSQEETKERMEKGQKEMQKGLADMQKSQDVTKKSGESLQEYASEVERLANLPFSDHPATVRETISLQYFVDGLKDESRNPEVLEAANEASCRDRHSVRGARVTTDAPCESPWRKEIEKLREEIQVLMAQRQNLIRRIACWGSDESVRKDQLADPEIKPIIALKESSDEKPRWQDIATFHPTMKRYWALWDSLHLRNGVLYRKWESDDGRTFSTGSHDSGFLYKCTPIKGETSILQFDRDCVKILTIDKTRTTTLHPQFHGMVDRFNRTMLKSLSLLVSSNQQDWDKKLPFFLLAYRIAVHETTSYSPSQMFFGRDLRLPANLLFCRPPDAPLAPEEYIEKARMEEMHQVAGERISMASEKMKTRYDVRATGHDFHECDNVWL